MTWLYELGRINVQLQCQGFRKLSTTIQTMSGFGFLYLLDSNMPAFEMEAVRVVMGRCNDFKIIMKEREKLTSYFLVCIECVHCGLGNWPTGCAGSQRRKEFPRNPVKFTSSNLTKVDLAQITNDDDARQGYQATPTRCRRRRHECTPRFVDLAPL